MGSSSLSDARNNRATRRVHGRAKARVESGDATGAPSVEPLDSADELFEVSFQGGKASTKSIPLSGDEATTSFWGAGSATSAPVTSVTYVAGRVTIACANGNARGDQGLRCSELSRASSRRGARAKALHERDGPRMKLARLAALLRCATCSGARA
jgi:hypothetical protein